MIMLTEFEKESLVRRCYFALPDCARYCRCKAKAQHQVLQHCVLYILSLQAANTENETRKSRLIKGDVKTQI